MLSSLGSGLFVLLVGERTIKMKIMLVDMYFYTPGHSSYQLYVCASYLNAFFNPQR